MPTVKIYPPTRLPTCNVSETQFSMWREELEVYLSQEAEYKVFLPNKLYSSWESAEEYPDRIRDLKEEDQVQENDNNRNGRAITAADAVIINDEKLESIRINLRTVLSIVAKCVSEGHYNSVVRHATSLTWIYDMLKSDYDIQSKGVHFFNILEAKFDPDKYTPIAFYNMYRTVVANNLGKRGERIIYKNEVLDHDEKFTPMLEDMILLNAIKEIDPKLPNVVKSFYFHKMKSEERIMDFKTDILLHIPTFLEQVNTTEDDGVLSAFKQFQPKKNNPNRFKKANSRQSKYCRICHLAQKQRNIFTSHNVGEQSCPSLSDRDRDMFINNAKLAAAKESDEDEYINDEELAEIYGYGKEKDESNDEDYQVENRNGANLNIVNVHRHEENYGYIQPFPSQILTVFLDKESKIPFHIELDSGATVSYIREEEALKHKFTIMPNNQVSKLGDGCTKFKAVGEIKTQFFRQTCSITFHAIVCKNLTAPAIGGTNFMRDNGIEQDLARNIIFLDNRRITVQPTGHTSIMPAAPIFGNREQVKKKQILSTSIF